MLHRIDPRRFFNMGCPATYFRFLKGDYRNLHSEAGGDVLLAKEAALVGISVTELRSRHVGKALDELLANLRLQELHENGARALGISSKELSNMLAMRDRLIATFPPHLQNSGVAIEIALFRMIKWLGLRKRSRKGHAMAL